MGSTEPKTSLFASNRNRHKLSAKTKH